MCSMSKACASSGDGLRRPVLAPSGVLLRRLKLGREESCRRLLTMLILDARND